MDEYLRQTQKRHSAAAISIKGHFPRQQCCIVSSKCIGRWCAGILERMKDGIVRDILNESYSSYVEEKKSYVKKKFLPSASS